MSKETGGTAFPTGTGGNTPYSNGMTLRDYFAAKAMQSMCAETPAKDFDHCASRSYKMADAMLEARK